MARHERQAIHKTRDSEARSGVGVPIRPRDFLTDVLFLNCGKLGAFAVEALSLARWSLRSTLSEARRIPLPCAFENPLDDVVLVRVIDGGDDSHPLATERANIGVDFPDFGDKARPVFSAKPHELRVLLDGDDAAGRRASSLTFLVHPAELPTNGRRECAVGMDAAFVSQCNMREEHGKELDAAGELVVAPEPRMEPSPPVEDATVVLVLGGELAN